MKALGLYFYKRDKAYNNLPEHTVLSSECQLCVHAGVCMWVHRCLEAKYKHCLPRSPSTLLFETGSLAEPRGHQLGEAG